MKIASPRTPDDPDDETDSDLRILKEIAELGMKMARAITQNAANAARTGQLMTGRNPSAASFDRIMKEVRAAVAMAATIERTRRKQIRDAADAERMKADAVSVPLLRLKKRVWHAIDSSLRAEPDRNYVQQKMRAVQLRLDDPTFGIEFGDEPVGVIVAAVCEELKIPFDGRRWTDEELGIKRRENLPPPKLH